VLSFAMKRSSRSTAALPLPKRRKDLDISDDDDVVSEIDVPSDADEESGDDEEEVAPPPPVEKDVEPTEHMADYARELERFQEDPSTFVPDHQAFEFAWALSSTGSSRIRMCRRTGSSTRANSGQT
jgi:hypothetical protein